APDVSLRAGAMDGDAVSDSLTEAGLGAARPSPVAGEPLRSAVSLAKMVSLAPLPGPVKSRAMGPLARAFSAQNHGRGSDLLHSPGDLLFGRRRERRIMRA